VKKSNKFKVFFNHMSNAGIAYYRMISPAKYMRKIKGVEVAYSAFYPEAGQNVSWENDLMNSADTANAILAQVGSLMNEADISVWQMCHNDMSLAMFLGFRDKRLFGKKKILMEIDDDAFNVNAESYASLSYHSGSVNEDIVKKQIENASGLIVTTEYLKKVYEHLNPYIAVIPNGIDFEVWDNLEYQKSNRNRIRIGWAGGQAHNEDLKIMGKVIPLILSKYQNVEFMFMGHKSEYIPYGENVYHHTNTKGSPVWVGIDKYPQELANLKLDIGIAPLRDNRFNRAKSNLRFLEYGAMGIPTVASNVEPFKHTISDGLIKVTEVEEWVDALSSLIESQVVRQLKGRVAYNDVKAKYNVEKIAETYTQVLQKFASGRIMSSTKEIKPELFDVSDSIDAGILPEGHA